MAKVSMESVHKPRAPQVKVKAIAAKAMRMFETANTTKPITEITPSQPRTGILEFPLGIAINSRTMFTKPLTNSRIGLKKYLNERPSLRLPLIESATSPAQAVKAEFSGTGNSRVALPFKICESATQTKNSPASNQLRRITRGADEIVGSALTLMREYRLRRPAICREIRCIQLLSHQRQRQRDHLYRVLLLSHHE